MTQAVFTLVMLVAATVAAATGFAQEIVMTGDPNGIVVSKSPLRASTRPAGNATTRTRASASPTIAGAQAELAVASSSLSGGVSGGQTGPKTDAVSILPSGSAFGNATGAASDGGKKAVKIAKPDPTLAVGQFRPLAELLADSPARISPKDPIDHAAEAKALEGVRHLFLARGPGRNAPGPAARANLAEFILMQRLSAEFQTASIRIESQLSPEAGPAEEALALQFAEAVKTRLTAEHHIAPERVATVVKTLVAGTGRGAVVLCGPAGTLESAGKTLDAQALRAAKAQLFDPTRLKIEISISQCRLFLYEKSPSGELKLVRPYVVATAKAGTPYPEGLGHITHVDMNPWWYPPETVKRQAEAEGREAAPVAPGLPSNPMGAFKMHLSHGSDFRIHGTNKHHQLGRRVSLGCVRMANVEGKELAQVVGPGTEVEIKF